MATEAMGLPFEATSAAAWLVWILPFVAALIMPAVGKASKNLTGYVAVGFALMSALSAASLIPVTLDASEIHHQITWIERRSSCRSAFCNYGKCGGLDFFPNYDLQYRLHER